MPHPKKCTCALCENRRNKKREKRERLAELSGELEAAEQIAAERAAAATPQQTTIEQPPPAPAAVPAVPPEIKERGSDSGLEKIIKINMGGQPAQISEQEAAGIAAEAVAEQPSEAAGISVDIDEKQLSQSVIGLMIGGVMNVILIIVAYLIGVKASNFDVVMLDSEEIEQIGEAATPYINKKLKNSEDFELYALLGGLAGIVTKKAVVMIEVLKVQEAEQEKIKADIAEMKKEISQQRQPAPAPAPAPAAAPAK
jgi:hypothetical protein